MAKTINENPVEYAFEEIKKRDDEIARLKKENEELRKQLEGGGTPPDPIDQ
jgi:hypothetical protein